MIKIGESLFLKPLDVNSAFVFSKEEKYQVCFNMKKGEPIFSDKFAQKQEALDLAGITNFGLKKVQEDLFVKSDNVKTARIVKKDLKVCITFNEGEPTFTTVFANKETAEKFILDNF